MHLHSRNNLFTEVWMEKHEQLSSQTRYILPKVQVFTVSAVVYHTSAIAI